MLWLKQLLGLVTTLYKFRSSVVVRLAVVDKTLLFLETAVIDLDNSTLSFLFVAAEKPPPLLIQLFEYRHQSTFSVLWSFIIGERFGHEE